MRLDHVLKLGIASVLLFGILSAPSFADHDGWGGHDRHRPPGQNDCGDGARGPCRQSHPEHYQLDRRYWHDRYYPRRGYTVDRLPDHNHHLHFRDQDYFFHGGVWYRPYSHRYVVVAPPAGVVVPTLPAFYTTVWIGGIPYYYANDAYYIWRPERNGYLVTEPPADVDEQPQSVMTDELIIYPKRGQSEKQQADDRYACHHWGVSQTNYDPSQPPQNMSPEQLSEKRTAYQRAMQACLEGRGYSVR